MFDQIRDLRDSARTPNSVLQITRLTQQLLRDLNLHRLKTEYQSKVPSALNWVKPTSKIKTMRGRRLHIRSVISATSP